MNLPPSDECLNALIDGELVPSDAEPVLEQLSGDAALRERLSRLQLGKALVRHAYAELDPPQRAPAVPTWQRGHPLAAGFAGFAVLGLSAVLGWVAHDRLGGPGALVREMAAARATDAAPLQQRADHRIVVHLSEASQALAALERAQGLLEAARSSGHTVAVEIVANGGGLDLLRESVSEHAARIAALRAAHPGLALVACGRTVQRLRDGGADVRLLPGTLTASSALDEIVLRAQQGWAYVRV